MKTPFYNLSIQRKQTLIAMLTTAVTLLVVCGAFAVYEVITFRKAMAGNLSMLAEIIGANVSAGVDSNDPKSAQETLSTLKNDPDIMAAWIFSKDGKILARYDRPGGKAVLAPPKFQVSGHSFGVNTLVLHRPIMAQGKINGVVCLESNPRLLHSRLAHYAAAAGVIILSALFAVYFLSSRLQQLVSKPILSLVETAREVAREKDYSLRAVKGNEDELGMLADAFNEMLAQIQARDAAQRQTKYELELRVEERMRELAYERDLLRDLLDHSPDHIYFKDAQSRFIKCGRGLGGVFGMTAEQLIGKSDADFFPPETAQKFLKEEQEIMRTGIPLINQVQKETLSDGSRLWVLNTTMPLHDKDGKITGTFGISKDITAMKEIEEALSYERDLLRDLLEHSPDHIYFKDARSRFVKCGKTLAGAYGFTPGELIGKSDADFFPPETAQKFLKEEQEIMRTGIPLINQVQKETLSDGSRLWVLNTTMPLHDKDGKITGTFGISKDITAMKEIEEALSYERDLLRDLLEHSPDHIYFKDARSRFVKCGKTLAGAYGFTPGELIGKSDTDLFPPETAQKFLEEEQEIMRTGIPIIGQVQKEILKNGMETWAINNKMPLRDKDGGIIGTFGMCKDITAMKEIEEALYYERDLLRILLDNSPDYIYFKDAQSRFIKCSSALAEAFGVPAEQVIGKSDADFFPPELAQKFLGEEREVMRAGIPLVNMLDHMHTEIFNNGREAWLLSSTMPFRNKDGAVIGIFGISKDITVMKQAEIGLARERDLLGALLDNSPDHIYFKDAQSRFIRCGKAVAAKKRVPLDELMGKSDADYFAPEDAQKFMEEEQEIMRTGIPLINNLQMETSIEGVHSWTLNNKMPLRDRDGKIIGTFGITKDITPMKEAEEKLERLHRELLETSRMAGMAEVATSVLHNVGNVLNSVNVSCSVVSEKVRTSRVANLSKAAALLESHKQDLAAFLNHDPKGRELPNYLANLAVHLGGEREEMMRELCSLTNNIEHIKEIIAMQQNYARVSGVTEALDAGELVDDAIRMNAGALDRHGVHVVREYQGRLRITLEKHKVLQILVNLIRNAKNALDEGNPAEKRITARIAANGDGRVKISIIDNGMGISGENLTRIFAHGFTTRKDGHGFGLHSASLTARELGGTLAVQSEGTGKGAMFTLEMPTLPPGQPGAHPNHHYGN